MLPNFLIVGAQKAGTTSVFKYLSQHPDIYSPFCKEPHYFSNAPFPNLAKNDEEYENLFQNASHEKAIGEASVSYLIDPQAPIKIKKLIPEVKIIILLREPVERSYSQWWHMYQLGHEKHTFEKALKIEQERINSKHFQKKVKVYSGFFSYFQSSMYYNYVNRYINTFGKENVRIYIFEEFIKNLPKLCNELFRFLNVDPEFIPDFKVYNKSRSPKLRSLQIFLTKPPPFLKIIFDSLPRMLKEKIFNALKMIYWKNMRETKRPTLNPLLRKSLHNKFITDIHKLEELVKKDLSAWYE